MPDCWCCAQKLHPVLIVIVVYAVNRLYVEKGTEKFLGVESLVLCYISYIQYFVKLLFASIKLTVYMLRMTKNSNTGNFYVEQIINMSSRLGNQRGGDWRGVAIDFHYQEEVVVCFNKVEIKSFVYHIHIPTDITTSISQPHNIHQHPFLKPSNFHQHLFLKPPFPHKYL